MPYIKHNFGDSSRTPSLLTESNGFCKECKAKFMPCLPFRYWCDGCIAIFRARSLFKPNARPEAPKLIFNRVQELGYANMRQAADALNLDYGLLCIWNNKGRYPHKQAQLDTLCLALQCSADRLFSAKQLKKMRVNKGLNIYGVTKQGKERG